jgi:hypothetical protein
MWLVLLKFAKDQFLGVDTPEQPVPTCVCYVTTFLLIRDAIGGVSCSVVWGITQEATWEPHGARGAWG